MTVGALSDGARTAYATVLRDLTPSALHDVSVRPGETPDAVTAEMTKLVNGVFGTAREHLSAFGVSTPGARNQRNVALRTLSQYHRQALEAVQGELSGAGQQALQGQAGDFMGEARNQVEMAHNMLAMVQHTG